MGDGCGVVRDWWEKGGEMTQTLYANMNKKSQKKPVNYANFITQISFSKTFAK
jgi:hypothetical protein